ncbi:hypothetical protein OC844_005912 [Tilletia horrida]|nr:hypothetical protein OC844_005912 [Tilletia horrida]
MPTRAGPPLLSFSQSIYLLITLFQAYTYLGLTFLRIKDALPERHRILATTSGLLSRTRRGASSSGAAGGARGRGGGGGGGSHHRKSASSASASATAAHLAAVLSQPQRGSGDLNLTQEELHALLFNDEDEADNAAKLISSALGHVPDEIQQELAIIGAVKGHARAVYGYHTFLHFQRTAGLQPSLTARLPAELVRKIMIHAGVPTRRSTRSPFELPASPVAILSLNRTFHAALLPKVYHSLVVDRPRLFRSLRMTLSQRPPLSASATVQLPQPGDHIRTLHIGSALFGDVSTIADLMNSDEDDEDDGQAHSAAAARRRSSARRRSISTEDAADSDEEGYLPTHLASGPHLSTGIELILLAAPQLHTLSLDLFALTALYTGTPRRFSRAPRPRVLRCELAIPQVLSLRIFRDVQAIELLCFGMDAGSALELCASLPRGCTEVTLRFVRRRRTYAATGAGSAQYHQHGALGSMAGASAGAAARARAFFGLDGGVTDVNVAARRGAAIDATVQTELDQEGQEEEEDEEEEDDDFHSAHETEEAVRNLAAAVRVLQFSGRSPALFAQPPVATSWSNGTAAAPSGTAAFGSSPASSSHNQGLTPLQHPSAQLAGSPLGAGMLNRRNSAQFSVGSASPYGTPRAAHVALAGSPRAIGASLGGVGVTGSPSAAGSALVDRRSPALALVGLPDHPGGSPRAPTRVSEFFHPDAVPPPNSVIRLHSMDSSYSSSLADEEDEEDMEGSGVLSLSASASTSSAAASPTTASDAARMGSSMLGLEVGEETRRASEDSDGPSPGTDEDVELLAPMAERTSSAAAVPIPILRPQEQGRGERSSSLRSATRMEDTGGSATYSSVSVRGRSTATAMRSSGEPSSISSGVDANAQTNASQVSTSSATAAATSASASGTGGSSAPLPPEFTLTSIRVLAWPAAVRRLRQYLPDAVRIADEPSGSLVPAVGAGACGAAAQAHGHGGSGGPKLGKLGKTKGKGKARDLPLRPGSSSGPAAPWDTSVSSSGATPLMVPVGMGTGMPALGPYPASLGLGTDSVHARGPRRGVQELWSRWAREQAGGLAV